MCRIVPASGVLFVNDLVDVQDESDIQWHDPLRNGFNATPDGKLAWRINSQSMVPGISPA